MPWSWPVGSGLGPPVLGTVLTPRFCEPFGGEARCTGWPWCLASAGGRGPQQRGPPGGGGGGPRAPPRWRPLLRPPLRRTMHPAPPLSSALGWFFRSADRTNAPPPCGLTYGGCPVLPRAGGCGLQLRGPPGGGGGWAPPRWRPLLWTPLRRTLHREPPSVAP